MEPRVNVSAFKISVSFQTISSDLFDFILISTFFNKINLRGGEIVSLQCECPRREYKCSHAAALAIQSIHNLSRTNVLCEWKKQKAPGQVKSVEELYPCPKENSCLKRDVTNEDRAWLYGELKKYGNFNGTLWILSPKPSTNDRLPSPTVEDIVISEEFVNYDGDKKGFLVQKLMITNEQHKAIQETTIGQRDNPSWHLLRNINSHTIRYNIID